MARRVVITACSAITPIGQTRAEIVRHLTEGRLRRQAAAPGRPPLRVHPLRGLRDGRLSHRVRLQAHPPQDDGAGGLLRLPGGQGGPGQSGLAPEFITSGRLGVAFGSTHGSPSVQRQHLQDLLHRGRDRILPSIGAVDYLKSMVHTTAVNITKMFGITGRVISSSTACTTSSQSIGYGYETVKFGMQDAMLCGGADEYDTTTVAVFDNLLACSTAFNDHPAPARRGPSTASATGWWSGRAPGRSCWRSTSTPRQRGADILGEVIGFCLQQQRRRPDPAEPGRDQRNPPSGARDAAASTPAEVDFVSAHATATKMGDVIEAQAIQPCTAHRPGDGPQELHGAHHGLLRRHRDDHDPLHDGGRVCRPDPQPGGGRRALRHDPPQPRARGRARSASRRSRISPSAA